MKLMVGRPTGVEPGTVPHVYAIDGDAAADLSAADPTLGADLSRLIARGTDGLAAVPDLAGTAPHRPVAEVVPALPLAAPGKIVCLGLNYVDHAKEGGYAVPDYPVLFLRATTSLLPAGGALVRPACSETFDYEAELLVVIGRRGRHIAESQALDHVFGYTLFNDGSVRAYQRRTHQWTAGKNFDATGAIGPAVVTADELPAGAAGLAIQTRLNGAVVQSANTADMIFPVARTLSILSEVMTLEPGDLIAMGTPPGVGHARTPPLWMRGGDTVEVEIEGIGVCRNPVVDEAPLATDAAA